MTSAARNAIESGLRGHPHLVYAAAVVGGLASAGMGAKPLPLETVVIAAGLVWPALAWARAPLVGAACVVLLLTGWAVGSARTESIDAPAAAMASGILVDGRAILLEQARPSAFGSTAEVEVLEGRAAGAHLVARLTDEIDWPQEAEIGDELLVTGWAAPPDPDPDADFDWASHLRRTGVAGELDLDRVEATDRARGGVAGVIDAVRERSERALELGASGDQAALIRGMVLGQDERIDELVRDDFRAAGLAHLLAVSGQNVMLLAVLVLPIAATLGLGPRARLVAIIVLVAAYVPLAGAGPSLQRAGVAGVAGFAALALGRPASRCYTLLLAAVATLGMNPRVCGDPGWQLSFVAVAGILVLGAPLRSGLGGLPRWLAEGVAMTVAAGVATAPLLMHHFDQASPASLPANLLALPAVAPAMWIGMVQMAFGQGLSAGAPVSLIAGAAVSVLGTVNGVLLDYLAELARHFAELPWAEVAVGLDTPLSVAAAYAVIAATAVSVLRVARRAGPTISTLGGRWRTSPPGARAALALVAATALLGAAATATDNGDAPDALTVAFLDVGQGDATLVQHPGGGSILIDGGPVEARVYRMVRAAGVDRLGLVVATHAAADHHGGLREVLQHMPVDTLLEGGDGTTDPDFQAMLAEAERQGVRTIPATAGQVLGVGELTLEVLWPEPRKGPPPDDPNMRAVTTLVSAGDFELLASGDAESPSLAALDLPDVDLLKVPHHGSEDPGLPAVLAELRPEAAGIGVGEDNGYGHPTPSTLAALEEAGAEVYRTDLDGTVEATVVGGELRVTTER